MRMHNRQVLAQHIGYISFRNCQNPTPCRLFFVRRSVQPIHGQATCFVLHTMARTTQRLANVTGTNVPEHTIYIFGARVHCSACCTTVIVSVVADYQSLAG